MPQPPDSPKPENLRPRWPSRLYVEISYSPRWAYVEAIREFVRRFCLIHSLSTEQSERIVIATSELLENSIKYSYQDEIYFRAEILAEKKLKIFVKNITSVENARILQEEISRLSALPPKEAYLAKLFEVAQDPSKSRLGLARIQYEAGATLQVTTEKNTVLICAEFPLDTDHGHQVGLANSVNP